MRAWRGFALPQAGFLSDSIRHLALVADRTSLAQQVKFMVEHMATGREREPLAKSA
jgi:hypothetical protein